MTDEQERDGVGTSLDDGAEPGYEDGSPLEVPPEPNPTEPGSAVDAGGARSRRR